jgi:2-oxoglutarate dehydrogenase E1 component
VAAAAELFESFPNVEELVWAQEEPQNMGAWRSIRHRLEALAREGGRARLARAAADEALPESVTLRFVGRPWRASPSEGYPTAHLREQDRILREALS